MPLCNRFRSLINKRMKIPLLLVCTIEVNRMRRIHQLQNLSFTVTLTQDAAARFLKRAKNVKDCKKLKTEIEQSVVSKSLSICVCVYMFTQLCAQAQPIP